MLQIIKVLYAVIFIIVTLYAVIIQAPYCLNLRTSDDQDKLVRYRKSSYLFHSIFWVLYSIALIITYNLNTRVTDALSLLSLVWYLSIVLLPYFDTYPINNLTEETKDTTLLRSPGVAEHDPASKI